MNKASLSEYGPGETNLDPDLKHLFEVIRNRRATFLRVFLIILAVGIAATLLSKPVYQTRVQFLVPMVSPSLQLVEANNPVAAILSANQPDSVSTQVRELASEPFINDAKAKIGIKPGSGAAEPSVKTEAVKDTNIIQVTVDGPDPKQIVRLAKKIIELHIENTDKDRQDELGRTINYARTELTKADQALHDAIVNLVAFQSRSRPAQVHAKQETWAKQVADLEERMLEAQSNVTSTRAQISRLQSQIAALPMDSVRQHARKNPLRAELQKKLDALRIQRLELLQDFSPSSKRVTTLDKQIRMFARQLERVPETIPIRDYFPNPSREGLEAKLRELQAALVQYEEDAAASQTQFNAQAERLSSMGSWEIHLAALTQKRDLAQARVNSLTERLQDLEFRKNVKSNTFRVIEWPSIPQDPIRPKPLVNLAVTILAGLLLATGMVFLQEYLDDRVNQPDDIERLCALPTLGHVPAIGEEQSTALALLTPNSPAAEAYRGLRSSIMFSALDAPIHRLQITSASRGEGKTTTAVNLAIAMALDGKRVILVDSDLRRSSVHRVMGIPASPGLSEVLISFKTLDEVIRPTQIEGLSVIPAGAIPPNPAELLGREAFDRVLEELEERADIVIVDSAPCLPVTDPLIVAARMHGVVLVVYAGQTKKAAVKQSVMLLERTRARLMGVVFNRVDTSRSGYYREYYADGYYHDSDSSNGRSSRNGKVTTANLASAQKLPSMSASASDTEPDS